MSANVARLPTRNARARSGEASGARDFIARAEAAAKIAEAHAVPVDTEARFPAEAFAALREQKLLGVLVPAELGGEGARAADVAEICSILGRACASTAMIYAMHQVKVACLIRHDRGNAWLADFLRRVVSEELLLASSTTEGNNGGNVRSSEAAVRRDGDRIKLDRQASVISYGEAADAIVTTARRSDSAANSDQVLLVLHRSDYQLVATGGWDTLGMRGTCSAGYRLIAEGVSSQMLSEPYERIHSATMVPYAHMFWSSAWHGVASGAVMRAKAFVRAAARASGGKTPPAAAHLTRARITLDTLRAAILSAIGIFEAHAADPGGLTAMDAQLALTFLKVEASELAVAAVLSAMRACGLAGYRNDGEFSMGRYLRDILSSPIMINNDRILANAESAVLMSEVPAGLSLN